ncbi:MAG: hypothetical protein AABZ75_00455 [candidate division NC10 bacterium]|nr:hypothetical protein [candidate division NC10 bacterium]
MSLREGLGELLGRVQAGEGLLVMDRDGLPVEALPGESGASPEAIGAECVPLLREAEALAQGLNLGAWTHFGLMTVHKNIHFVPLGQDCTLALLTRATGNAATGRRAVREGAQALRALL